LRSCRKHLRSSQPFYQHLYRHVKKPTQRNSTPHDPLKVKFRYYPEESGSDFIEGDQQQDDGGARLQKHQHVFDVNVSEVWIIISDLFQTLELDQCLPSSATPSPRSSSLRSQFPQQAAFFDYLEAQSGLSLVDIRDAKSHNYNNTSHHNTTLSHSEAQLELLRSQERVLLFVLRDL